MQVLLIDDHVMFRQGVKFLLSDLDESLQFFEADNCEQALGLLHSEAVNLILLDLNMPGSQDLSALQAVISVTTGVPVAILSGDENPSLIRAAIEAGASGYVPKSSNSDILVAALKLILAGGVYLPPTALDDVALSADISRLPKSPESRADLLSGRQTAVLLRAVQGQPNKVIALDLGIAEGTVKAHLSAAFKVLGVHNRTEAVFAAARLGLRPAPITAE